MLFNICISESLTSGGLLILERQLLPGQASQFLERVVKYQPKRSLFIYSYNQPMRSPYSTYLLQQTLSVLILRATIHLLLINYPVSYTRQLERADTPQTTLKLNKLANPKPVNPALSTSSHGNHNKGSFPQFPPALCCLLTDLGISPCGLCTVSHSTSSWKL